MPNSTPPSSKLSHNFLLSFSFVHNLILDWLADKAHFHKSTFGLKGDKYTDGWSAQKGQVVSNIDKVPLQWSLTFVPSYLSSVLQRILYPKPSSFCERCWRFVGDIKNILELIKIIKKKSLNDLFTFSNSAFGVQEVNILAYSHLYEVALERVWLYNQLWTYDPNWRLQSIHSIL